MSLHASTPRKTVPVQVTLSKPTYKLLQEWAQAEGSSAPEVLRELIDLRRKILAYAKLDADRTVHVSEFLFPSDLDQLRTSHAAVDYSEADPASPTAATEEVGVR
jgi:hypothetical protein